jgi:poly(3-hydroxybutyrate) depolymerase
VRAALVLGLLALPAAGQQGSRQGPPVIKKDDALPAKPGLLKRMFTKSFYMLHVPGGYKPDKRYGLILFLHGSGGRAEGAVGTFGMALDKGYLLMSPETIAQDRMAWDPEADGDNIVEMTEEILRVYSIDRDRILVGGFSAGGAQTLPQIARRPDLYTAGTPCGGCCYNQGLEKNMNLAFYIFAGRKDFAWGGAKLAYEEMDKKGFEVKFVDPPEIGHAMEPGGWQKIFDWFDGLVPEDQRPYLHQARDLVAAKAYGKAATLCKKLISIKAVTRYARGRAAILLGEIEELGKKELAAAQSAHETGDTKKAAALLAKAKIAFEGADIAEKIEEARKGYQKRVDQPK